LIDRLGLFEAEMLLLMPVRVTRAKNIEYALRVIAELKRRLNPKLILTGPPDPHDPKNMKYFQSLLKLCQELGIEDNIHFVYQSGPLADEPYLIDSRVVGDLYRVSDVVFMPSHREGFGLPVLEAGLAGAPVVCTNIPAAQEIGKEDVTIFSTGQSEDELAELIIKTVESNPVSRFRRRVRQDFTWEALFKRRIEPLIANP
jgi:glycosyltransferase involved in cell wall biosynthesis